MHINLCLIVCSINQVVHALQDVMVTIGICLKQIYPNLRNIIERQSRNGLNYVTIDNYQPTEKRTEGNTKMNVCKALKVEVHRLMQL